MGKTTPVSHMQNGNVPELTENMCLKLPTPCVLSLEASEQNPDTEISDIKAWATPNLLADTHTHT